MITGQPGQGMSVYDYRARDVSMITGRDGQGMSVYDYRARDVSV
jgi:hypothetical protein